MKKIINTSDVTSWTFSVYASMDSDPCETLLSDMRILTQLFINARAEIVSIIIFKLRSYLIILFLYFKGRSFGCFCFTLQLFN